MNNPNFMKILDAIKKLMKEFAGLIFFNSLFFDNVFKQLTFFHVVSN